MEKVAALEMSRQGELDRMFWALLTVGLLLFAMVTIPPGARHARALRQDLMRARAAMNELQGVRQVLSQRERALQSDPFYNEAVLRAKMKHTKPGEKEVNMAQPGRWPGLIETPETKPYAPTGNRATPIARSVTSWALLSASFLLMASAFIFFDRPSSPAPKARPLPPHLTGE